MSTDNNLLGAITEQDMTRWQIQGATALAKLLNNAFHEGLPAIDWQLATGSALVGRIARPSQTPAEQRAAFEAWSAYLMVDGQERTSSTGRTTLHAQAKRHPAYDVDITLITEFYADEACPDIAPQ
ncbi:hypothetical protein ACFVVL_34840 [Kitasatospora sp. NPDC058115]|uniref:hypothetical protein n=1 Tax=Kitasatospora sp. NPDC058115 TaxID=3346347 RepID=UPI0036D8B9FD